MKYKADKLFGKKSRIWELDFLRGLAICLMIFDHFMFDLACLPSIVVNYWESPSAMELGETGYAFFMSDFRNACHYIFASLFLLITGISCTLSSRQTTRVIKLFLMAGILTAATAFVDSVASVGALIVFGVIHCMAIASLLYAIIDKAFGKQSDIMLLLFGAAFIIIGICIAWYDMQFVDLPSDAGEAFKVFMRAVVGLDRVGSDHFPLFPCAGVVLVGSYIGKKFYADKRSLLPRLDGGWNNSFVWIGQRTAYVYLLHQPLVIIIVGIIGLINGWEVF